MLKKNSLFTLSLLCLSTLSMFPLSAVEVLKKMPVEQTSINFTAVAKKATPAVVSIKVKADVKQKSASNPSKSNDNFNDFFNDDFLKKFFGIPRSKNEDPDEEERRTIGQASGFLVSSDGMILTNSHVVKEAEEIEVTLNDGREFSAHLVGQDPNTDIALIKIDAKDLPFLTFMNSDELQVGEWAIAIGNPWGLQATLTVGVISATGRNNLNLAQLEDFIQTDAAINQGNSGGPLLNFYGEVAGMNTAIITSMNNGGNMGIGFAIPSNLIKHIMDEIITTGKVTRGFLGVMLQPMDQNLAKAFNLDKSDGALVTEITKDSPAEKAGLKQGDIVLKYNNQHVVNIASLRNAIALMKPESKINLTVLRQGQTLEIPIVIGTFPSAVEKPQAVETKGNQYGFSVQELTPELSKSLNLGDEKGVLISKIEPGTAAAWSGLKKGTLIIGVNQKKVTTVEEFNKAIEQIDHKKPLLLLVKQGEAVRFISIQVN
jgi:serine protease Do